MVRHRALGNYQPLCDLGVAQPLSDEHHHVALAPCDTSDLLGVLACTSVFGFELDLLKHLRPVGQHADPVRDRHQKSEISLGEEVRLQRIRLQDPSPLAINNQFDIHRALDTERLERPTHAIRVLMDRSR